MAVWFAKFTREHFMEYLSWYDESQSDVDRSFPDETWFRYLQNDDAKALAVLDEQEKLVAQVQIDRDPDGEGYVALSVKPEMQNQGIGSQALQALLESGELDGLKRVVAYTRDDDLASIKLLKKCGFHDHGHEDENGLREYIYDLA